MTSISLSPYAVESVSLLERAKAAALAFDSQPDVHEAMRRAQREEHLLDRAGRRIAWLLTLDLADVCAGLDISLDHRTGTFPIEALRIRYWEDNPSLSWGLAAARVCPLCDCAWNEQTFAGPVSLPSEALRRLGTYLHKWPDPRCHGCVDREVSS